MNPLGDTSQIRRKAPKGHGPQVRLMVDNFGHVKSVVVPGPRPRVKRRVKKGQATTPASGRGHEMTSPEGKEFVAKRKEYKDKEHKEVDFLSMKERHEAEESTRAPEPTAPLPRSGQQHRAGVALPNPSPYGQKPQLGPKYRPVPASGHKLDGKGSHESAHPGSQGVQEIYGGTGTRRQGAGSEEGVTGSPQRPASATQSSPPGKASAITSNSRSTRHHGPRSPSPHAGSRRSPKPSPQHNGDPSHSSPLNKRAPSPKANHQHHRGSKGQDRPSTSTGGPRSKNGPAKVEISQELVSEDNGVLHTYMLPVGASLVSTHQRGIQIDIPDPAMSALQKERDELADLLTDRETVMIEREEEAAALRRLLEEAQEQQEELRSRAEVAEAQVQHLEVQQKQHQQSHEQVPAERGSSRQVKSELAQAKKQIEHLSKSNGSLQIQIEERDARIAELQQQLEEQKRQHETSLAEARLQSAYEHPPGIDTAPSDDAISAAGHDDDLYLSRPTASQVNVAVEPFVMDPVHRAGDMTGSVGSTYTLPQDSEYAQFDEQEVWGDAVVLSEPSSDSSFGSADLDEQYGDFDGQNHVAIDESLSDLSDNDDEFAMSLPLTARNALAVGGDTQQLLEKFNAFSGLFGRAGTIAQALSAVEQGGCGVLVTGPSGAGKTAFVTHLANKLKENDAYRVIPHYCGHIKGSTNVRGLLLSLCAHLASQIESDPEDISDLIGALQDQDFFALRRSLSAMIETLIDSDVKIQQMVLVIDNLEDLQHGWQPTENISAVSWMPHSLPPYLSIVCSIDSEVMVTQVLKGRGWVEVPLTPLAPEDCRSMLAKMHPTAPPWLAELGEQIGPCWPEQVRLAAAILSMSQPGQKMTVPMPLPSVERLVNIMFEAIEKRVGAVIAQAALLTLSQMRIPLYDYELTFVIKSVVDQPVSVSATRAVVQTLQPLLMRGELTSGLFLATVFMKKAILGRYICDLPPLTDVPHLDSKYFRHARSRTLQEIHGHIVNYLTRVVDPMGDLSYQTDDDRALYEFVYHQLNAGSYAGIAVSQSLGSAAFVQTRLSRGHAHYLLNDFCMVEQTAALYNSFAAMAPNDTIVTQRPQPKAGAVSQGVDSVASSDNQHQQGVRVGGSIQKPGLLIAPGRVNHHLDVLARHFVPLSLGLQSFEHYLNEQSDENRSRKCLTYSKHQLGDEEVTCTAQSLSAPLLVISGARKLSPTGEEVGLVNVWTSDSGNTLDIIPIPSVPVDVSFVLHRDDLYAIAAGESHVYVCEIGSSSPRLVLDMGPLPEGGDSAVSIHLTSCPVPDFWSLAVGTTIPPAPSGDSVGRLLLVARGQLLHVFNLDQALQQYHTPTASTPVGPTQTIPLFESPRPLALCEWVPVSSKGKTPAKSGRPVSTSGTIIAVDQNGETVYHELRVGDMGPASISLIRSGAHKFGTPHTSSGSVAISPNGSYLAVLEQTSAGNEPSLSVFDWLSGTYIAQCQPLAPHESTSAKASVISTSDDTTTGAKAQEYVKITGPICFAPSQSSVFVSYGEHFPDSKAEQFLVSYSLTKVPTPHMKLDSGPVSSLATCPTLLWANSVPPASSTEIVSSGPDGSVYVWDISRGRPHIPVLDQRTEEIRQVSLAVGDLCVTMSHGGAIGLWDIHSVSQAGVLDEDNGSPGSAIAISPRGTQAISYCQDGPVQLWCLLRGRGLFHMWPAASIIDIEFLDDTHVIVAQQRQPAAIAVWRITCNTVDRNDQAESGVGDLGPAPLPPAQSSSFSLTQVESYPVFNDDEHLSDIEVGLDTKLVLAGTTAGNVYVLDLNKKDLSLLVKGVDGAITGVSFTGGGASVVCGSDSGEVRVFEMKDQTQVYQVARAKDRIRTIEPIGDWGAIAHFASGTILTLHVNETAAYGYKPVDGYSDTVVVDHDSGATALCVRQQGKFIVTGHADGTITFWKQSGEKNFVEIHSLSGHSGPVADLVFDDRLWSNQPPTALLVSCGEDGSVRMWPLVLDDKMAGFK